MACVVKYEGKKHREGSSKSVSDFKFQNAHHMVALAICVYT